MKRLTTIFLSVVMAVAIIGFFVGLRDGVPQPDGFYESSLADRGLSLEDRGLSPAALTDTKLIPAVGYAEIARTPMGPTKPWQATPQKLVGVTYDLYRKVVPRQADKEASSKVRSSRRAFNGAPPVIAHPVEGTTDAACYACHSNGMQMAGLKASVMSHDFLSNCVQCHAPMAPAPFRHVDAGVENGFVGLPAPQAGQRAFVGAPPTIPHSQWMRENCNACHGGPHGWAGMESTHPWRSNCTQCHAPAATLDQMPHSAAVPMLPPPDVMAN